MSVKSIAQQKLQQAAAGNPVLLELLESLANTVTLTQQATNTTTKKVPPQATASVSYLKGNYIVQIKNPGAASPLSQLQAAQAKQGATQASTIQPVTPILHQVRCATSPGFGISAGVQTFGGDTGSTQTYWTLTNLGSGNFYFQIRSSYDGISFNQWKNANGGQSITSAPIQVTLESALNTEWAVFTLPGNQLMAVGEGLVSDQGTFGLPENLFSSSMAAIAGPNGFIDSGRHVSDIVNCDVIIQVPANTSGLVGIPDYPIQVLMKYGDQSNPQHLWSGDANIFAVAFDPAGENVTRYPSADGRSGWAVFTLPGGAKFAVGSGFGNHGDTIFIPSQCPWITAANMVSICSSHGDVAPHGAHGIQACALSGTTIQSQYSDVGGGSTNVWTGHANWFAVAWTPGMVTAAVTGGKFVIITLAGGNEIAFGGGVLADGSSFGVPAGFSAANMVTMATPASYTGSSDNVMHGVAQCDIAGTTAQLSYVDGSGNSWSGSVNWFAFCWTQVATRQPVGAPPVTPPTVPPATSVSISPTSATMAANTTISFTATVTGNADTTVTWSVQGSGTIDSSGNYTATSTSGYRAIIATSNGDPTVKAAASVLVSGGTTYGP